MIRELIRNCEILRTKLSRHSISKYFRISSNAHETFLWKVNSNPPPPLFTIKKEKIKYAVCRINKTCQIHIRYTLYTTLVDKIESFLQVHIPIKGNKWVGVETAQNFVSFNVFAFLLFCFFVSFQFISLGTQFPNEICLSFRKLILSQEYTSLYSFHIFQLFTPFTDNVRESLYKIPANERV